MWFSTKYESLMDCVIRSIRTHFQSRMEVDERYLNCLKKRAYPWDIELLNILLSGKPPTWESNDQTLGYNAIKIKNRSLFLFILPDYMLASIEVKDTAPFMSERSEMPLLLAQALSPNGWKNLEVFASLFEKLTTTELSTIRSVLELLAMRSGEPVAEISCKAIEEYWINITPLSP